MNDLANRRFTEQLNKEKDQRRAWAAHKQQQQIFEVRGTSLFLRRFEILHLRCSAPYL